MSRAQFKYALRQCRLEERSITSTKLAYHMQSHEFNVFWNEIRKQNKAKSALSNCVAGVTGETAIADMWRDHYEELLYSTASSHEKEDILEHFKSVSSHVGMQVIMLEVLQIVKDLPNAKSSGFDDLNGESLKYAHPLLCLLLSIGFKCMFKHCYIPQCMINSVIIPLIKINVATRLIKITIGQSPYPVLYLKCSNM